MVNPDQNSDEMTKLQKGLAPDGSSDCSDNRSLNHVQEMFPNDNLQLYLDDSFNTPVRALNLLIFDSLGDNFSTITSC